MYLCTLVGLVVLHHIIQPATDNPHDVITALRRSHWTRGPSVDPLSRCEKPFKCYFSDITKALFQSHMIED